MKMSKTEQRLPGEGLYAGNMSDAKKNEKRFMQFQHMLQNLQQQTNELQRLAIAADRRMRAPDAALRPTARKKREPSHTSS